MSQPGRRNAPSAPDAANGRLYGATRTALITLGIAAVTFLLSRHESGAAPQVLGSGGAGYVLGGLALQVLLMIAHAIIKRRAPDSASAAQGRLVIELIGDGITVLLFAMGTLGTLLHAASDA